MQKCKSVNINTKNCKIALFRSDNPKGHYISKCNTGKILAFNNKNSSELIRNFFEALLTRSKETNKDVEYILSKVVKKVDILAINYLNIKNSAKQLNIDLGLKDNVCLCILGINKHCLYLEVDIKTTKQHVFLNQYKNCMFIHNNKIVKMTEKLKQVS